MEKIIKEELSNGNTIIYRELESGTCYHAETPQAVISALESARVGNYRIRIFLGDTNTGKDWGEENDVIGYIGRSMGRIKIPLLIHNTRSTGGGGILDHCIVKIMKGKRTVYQHPKYDGGAYTIRDIDNTYNGRVYKAEVLRDGECAANFQHGRTFTARRAAERYVAFMKGERQSKGGM